VSSPSDFIIKSFSSFVRFQFHTNFFTGVWQLLCCLFSIYIFVQKEQLTCSTPFLLLVILQGRFYLCILRHTSKLVKHMAFCLSDSLGKFMTKQKNVLYYYYYYYYDYCSVMVKALCYKPKSRGFETRWGERIFLIYLILRAALGPGVHSASNRNEYQK
jgi:hypothetical protein